MIVSSMNRPSIDTFHRKCLIFGFGNRLIKAIFITMILTRFMSEVSIKSSNLFLMHKYSWGDFEYFYIFNSCKRIRLGIETRITDNKNIMSKICSTYRIFQFHRNISKLYSKKNPIKNPPEFNHNIFQNY